MALPWLTRASLWLATLATIVSALRITPVVGSTANVSPQNAKVVIDMVQNNPGDPVAWQQSKYFDARNLGARGYTGQTTTGEMSGTQAVDFHTLGTDFFPTGSPQRRWLDAYARGVQGFVNRTKAAGLKSYFFVDLLVFPTPVIAAYKDEITDPKTGQLVWNNKTASLLATLVNETFDTFPQCDGWIVRTGETYTYDTPYHSGNTPNPSKSMDVWVSFIKELSRLVNVVHGKDLFFRGWDNWPSDASYYEQMTNQIPTHPQLYFSIKHSAADFVRPAAWNPQLGVGQHAQIVEVELQREYEGKQAYPNYVMSGVIDGFPEMNPPIGLSSIIDNPVMCGLWTWTRGGGWWGPYIHGQEVWVDLHVRVLLDWWASKGSVKEPQVFASVVPDLIPGCNTSACVTAVRSLALTSANVVLHGQWGTIHSPGDWMRDDRIGGLEKTSGHFKSLGSDDAQWAASLAEKTLARNQTEQMVALYEGTIEPYVSDPAVAAAIGASVRYGQYLYTIVEAAWVVMQQGFRKGAHMPWNATTLANAINDYDAAYAEYRAFGLAEVYAASLYHPYYLCLGTACNCAFDPPPGAAPDGIGATVDSLRNATQP
eukprot:m.19844 g.19844  ORF g.19844 m.19844 type:complete len:597 (+) comp3731_c0_seq1:39-1829(+)